MNTTSTRKISKNLTKRITTNLNGKLHCSRFVHIELAGTNGLPESYIEKTVFTFITADNSHPPVMAKIYDACRQPLYELSGIFTMLSHDMEREEFILRLMEEMPGITLTSEIVTYFYKKEPII